MKKKNLQHNGLRLQLNKNVVSSLTSEELKGGTNASLFRDKDGNCYASVTTCPHESLPYATCGCPPETAQATCPAFCTIFC